MPHSQNIMLCSVPIERRDTVKLEAFKEHNILQALFLSNFDTLNLLKIGRNIAKILEIC